MAGHAKPRFPVGARVDACDPRGYWYPANVLEHRVRDERPQIRVHYVGWAKTLDAWVCASTHVRKATAGAKTLRERDLRQHKCTSGCETQGGEAKWQYIKLAGTRTRRRRQQVLVEWAECGGRDACSTWEPVENVDADDYEKYLAEHKRKRRRQREPRERKVATPHVLTVCGYGEASTAARQQRQADAELLQEEVARRATKQLRQQKSASQGAHTVFDGACSEVQFVGLWDRLAEMAGSLDGAHRAAHPRPRPPSSSATCR